MIYIIGIKVIAVHHHVVVQVILGEDVEIHAVVNHFVPRNQNLNVHLEDVDIN